MKPHIEEAQRALRLANRDIYAFTVLKKEEDVHLGIARYLLNNLGGVQLIRKGTNLLD